MRFTAAITVGAMFFGATMANSPSPNGPSPNGPSPNGPSPNGPGPGPGPGPELSSFEKRSTAAPDPSPEIYLPGPGPGPGPKSSSPDSDGPLGVLSDASSPSSPSPAGPGPDDSFFTGPKRHHFTASSGPASPGPDPPAPDHTLEVRSDAFSPSPAGPHPAGPEHPEHSLQVRSDASAPSPAGHGPNSPHPAGPEHPEHSLEVRSEEPDLVRTSDLVRTGKNDPKPIKVYNNKGEATMINQPVTPNTPGQVEQAACDEDLVEQKAWIRKQWAIEEEHALLDSAWQEPKDKVAARAKLTPEQKEALLDETARDAVKCHFRKMEKFRDTRTAELNLWQAERQAPKDKHQAQVDEDIAKWKNPKQKKQDEKTAKLELDAKLAAEKEAARVAEKEAAEKLAAEKASIKEQAKDAAADLKAEEKAAKKEAEEKLVEEKKAAEQALKDKLAADKAAAINIKHEAEAKLAAEKEAAKLADKLAAEKEEAAANIKTEEEAAKKKAEEEEAAKKEKNAENLADHFDPTKHGVTRVAKPKSCSCFETYSHILGYETKTSGPMDKFRLDIWAVKNRHCISYCTHPFSKSEYDIFRGAMKGKMALPGNLPDFTFSIDAGVSSGEHEKHEKRDKLAGWPKDPHPIPPNARTQLNAIREDIRKLKEPQEKDAKNLKYEEAIRRVFGPGGPASWSPSGPKSSPKSDTLSGNPKTANAELSDAYHQWLIDLNSSIKKARASIKEDDHAAHEQLKQQLVTVVEEAEDNFIKASEHAAAAAAVAMRKEVFEAASEAPKSSWTDGLTPPIRNLLKPPPKNAAGEVIDGVVSKAPVHRENPGPGGPP